MSNQAFALSVMEEERNRKALRPATLSFGEDGYYTSTIPGAPSSSRPLQWRLLRAGGAVQIASYPICEVARAPDWGWRMRNRFVEFYTEALGA